MSSCHARDAAGALSRLTNLFVQALPAAGPAAARASILEIVDLWVGMVRLPTGERCVQQISKMEGNQWRHYLANLT